MRLALYSRVSTRDKDQNCENQAASMRTWAAVQGHEIYREYSDELSGSGKVRRPEFDAMMADAEAHKFELLVFWSLDRFSRQGVLETLSHLRRLDDGGICWKSMTEQYLDSCGHFKEAIMGILAAIAKQERIRISERVHAGLAVARAAGRVGGRRKAVRDEKMLEKVRQMRESDCTLNQIAHAIGKSTATVHRILRDLGYKENHDGSAPDSSSVAESGKESILEGILNG